MIEYTLKRQGIDIKLGLGKYVKCGRIFTLFVEYNSLKPNDNVLAVAIRKVDNQINIISCNTNKRKEIKLWIIYLKQKS